MEYKILFASKTAFANGNGIIDGEWIDLKDKNAIKKIDAFKNAREGHEFFIGDSMASVYLDISEDDNPRELVNLVKRLEKLDNTQLEAYDVIMSELGWEREEALKKAENCEFDAIEWNDGSLEESVRRYYESYGRDIFAKNNVCDNGETIFVIY